MESSLYKIEQEYRELADLLIDSEVTPEIEAQLAINKENLQNKAVNYGFVCKQLSSECDIIDAEIERLQGLKKSRTKAVDKLKETLSQAMQLYMVEEIKTPIMKINFRKSESVEIDDVNNLPSAFISIKETISADKIAIKKAIQSGSFVRGAHIQVNQNIQIK